ncbi:MAG TPA: hypothetical protein PKJ41_11225 [Bryobacteraceae bacterium]|nr:hypothetical protein [Bryobacteraceae bacterium]
MRLTLARGFTLWLPALALLTAGVARGQAIEFESNGLRYLTLTRDGLTIMFAELPVRVRDYAVMQVAVSNGSASNRTVKPEDFVLTPADGVAVRATPARTVVEGFLSRAGRNDVIKLVSMYEAGLYGLSRFQSTSGYEQRRQSALAELTSSRLKAAATASAVALVMTKLKPGETTDGAVFFPLATRPVAPGKLVAQVGVERFEFVLDELKHPGDLVRRP